jgi:hypothetical protein
MSALPYLTDDEIANICEPLKRPAAQCKYLADTLKLAVHRKPNGRPLIARSEFERVVGANRFAPSQNDPHTGPNVVGMLAHLENRKHGKKTQGR